MAGIKMDMVLTDKVSPAAHNMRKAINGLVSVMEKVDSRFHGVFDNAGLKKATKQIVDSFELTNEQINKRTKLQNTLNGKLREQEKLEKELENLPLGIAERSKQLADANKKLEKNLATQKTLAAKIKRDAGDLPFKYNAMLNVVNNPNASFRAKQYAGNEYKRKAAKLEEDKATLAELGRREKKLRENVTTAENAHVEVAQKRADLEHRITTLKGEQAVLADQIADIEKNARADAEKAAQKQADSIQKQMAAVEKAEQQAIAAANAQDVDKWNKFDSSQESMAKLIHQAEERERREAAAVEAAEQKKIAAVNKEYEAKKRLWQKEQSKQQEITRERLTQEFAIEQAQQRYGKAIERANGLYAQANQKVRELGNTIDRNNKAQLAELNGAKQIATERQKIVDKLRTLEGVQAKINNLELRGISSGFQMMRLRGQEANLKRQIASHGRNIKSIESKTAAEIERQTRAQQKLNTQKKKTVKYSNQVWGALKRGTTAYLSAQSVLGVINTADSLTMTKARFDVMGDGKHSTDELMNMVYGASMRSRSGYLDMAASVSKLGIQAGNLFKTDGKQNNAAIVRFMENYNKMAVISGSTAQQTSAAMLQITQALSSGELRGDELRSVMENMPVVAQYVAKQLTSMGKGFFDKLPKKLKYIAKDGKIAADEILELGQNGLISAQTLRDAVLGATEDLNEKMKKMPYTWGQVWTIFKNAALKAFEPVLNGISAILKNEKFLEFANDVGQALVVAGRLALPVFNAVGNVIGWIYDKVKAVYNFISDNFGWIAPLVLGIAAALGVMYVAINAVAWATAISASLTKAWTAVQAAFNAVMAMNPVAWVIVAIIALIAVIYIVIAVINQCRDTSISATGVIFGAISWLGAAIYDVIIFVLKTAITYLQEMVNQVVDAAEWIYNAFNGGFTGWIGGVQNALWTFVNWALQLIKPLIEVWDKIKGTNYSASLQSTVDSKLNATKSGKYKEFGRIDLASKLEYANPNEWYRKAYSYGDNLSKKVEGFFDFSEYTKGLDGDKVNDFYKALTGGFDNPAVGGATGNPTLDKISGDTGDIAKNTGKSEEDFSYLRELAEREAINKYTLTDLKIDMTNNNNISNGVDSDSVMRRLAKQLSDAVLSTAEGITPW